MTHPLEDWRVVLCGCCGSEGRILYYTMTWRGYDEQDAGPCDCCEGTGGEMVPVFPIELSDLDEPKTGGGVG